MLKSYPGWVPYNQSSRSMKPRRPADEMRFFGLSLSRQRLAATIRCVVSAWMRPGPEKEPISLSAHSLNPLNDKPKLTSSSYLLSFLAQLFGTVTAVPLVLYFANVKWAVSLLAPFAPIMGLNVGGMFSTTGGVMFMSYSFLASLIMLIPSLAALVPLAAGQPWIGAAVAVTISWVSIFVWSYIDPTKRSIAVPRIFAIFLLMLGMVITTESVGWAMFRSTNTFIGLLMAGGVGIMWFSDPLCTWLTRELSVGLYNLGILLDASTQPIQAHAKSESFPHFHLDYPLPSVSKLRAKHQKQAEDISILMRENIFESIFASVESERNTKLLTSFTLVSDCIISIAAGSFRASSNILVSNEWEKLNEDIDDYVATSRTIFDEVIQCLNSMYSGNCHTSNFDDLIRQHDTLISKIMSSYTHDVKHDKPSLENRDNAATLSLDHWLFQLSQLNKAIHSLVKTVKTVTDETSQSGWGWLIGYHIKAIIMTFVLLVINTVYLLRCLVDMSLQPFRALGRKCCCRPRDEKSLDVEMGAPAPSVAAAPASPNPPPTGLAKLIAATEPPKIHMDDYIREGRYKFLIRFVIFATAVSAGALCMHLYWIPKVNTPFWMITSCLIVMSPTVGSTWRRTVQRACGTFIGALLGQIVVIVCVSTHRYVAFGPLILATMVTAYMQNSENGKYNYFWNICMLTFSIVVITDYPFVTGTSWKLAAYRFLFVFCGAIVGTLSSLVLPEYSYDRYISVARQLLSGSHKAVKLIHHSLAHNTPVDVPKLQVIVSGLMMLQGAAVAMRDDAVAEVFHRPSLAQSVRFLRYKIRDVIFTTRLQILSTATGFGSSVHAITTHFIKQAEKVIQNIDLEVEYVDARLKKHTANTIMPLTTDQVRNDFQALENNLAALMTGLSPELAVQINSHLTLFRVFCVSVHDLARAADHYYGNI